MTLYLKDARFIDWQSLTLDHTNLAVHSGPAGTFIKMPALPAHDQLTAADRILDCRGKFVTKSFCCGHHHIYSTLARGMPPPRNIPTNFPQILEYIWWNIDKRLDLEMIEASALSTAIHCAKNGVSFVIDHHASPFAIENSLATIAAAFDRVGIGHMLCYEMSDRDGQAISEQGLAETEAYLASGRPGHVGLHASFTVGDSLLARAIALAEKHRTGLHMHVAEDLSDQQHCQANFGKRVVERLHDAGALHLDKSILAHCIHLSDHERELLRGAGVWIVQNVESNQNNNVGLGAYSGLNDRMLLGTDGMHSDMLRSAKAAFLSGQATEGIDFNTIYQRFRNVHRYLEACGAPGDGGNNLVILDYDPPTEVNGTNFLGHFVYGIDGRHIETVIAQGCIIVEDRRITTVDEGDVLAHARAMGRKLWATL